MDEEQSEGDRHGNKTIFQCGIILVSFNHNVCGKLFDNQSENVGQQNNLIARVSLSANFKRL